MSKKLLLIAIIFCFITFTAIFYGKTVKAQVNLEILPTHSGYINDKGFYYVVGEVQNIGDTPVGDIQVNATFYNINGSIIATGSGNVKLSVLLPNRKAPFTITLYSGELSQQVYNYTISVASFYQIERKPLGLEILSNSSFFEPQLFRINGTIKNIGTQDTTFVRVIATFYNESGNVIEALLNYSSPSGITSGGTASFEVVINGTIAAKVHHWVLEAESWDYMLILEFNPTIFASSVLMLTFTSSFIINSYTRRRKRCNIKENAI